MSQSWSRRHFTQLIGGAAAAAALVGCESSPEVVQAINELPPGLPVVGDVSPVHDPAIIKTDGLYHLFTTSHLGEEPGLIHWRTSPDMVNWTMHSAVMSDMPEWAKSEFPKSKGIWAPDIIKAGDEYRLYYSVSRFGKNASAIGLIVTPSLGDDAAWTDRGVVVTSSVVNDYNAIDPAVFEGEDGDHWMSFGSFWGGLQMVQLDPETGLIKRGAPIEAVARRARPGAVEAPFVYKRGQWYYLFASFDFCCRGADSTYYTVVGRSKFPAGPYLDRKGKSMMHSGGFLVLHADLDPSGRYVGTGHCSIISSDDGEFIVYHAYDLEAEGRPTLRIQKLGWTEDDWPVAL